MESEKKSLKRVIRNILSESVGGITIHAYHGTSSILPFDRFSTSVIGSGMVTQGSKYQGFFFTTEKENAEYYTEWFVLRVKIEGVIENYTSSRVPREVLKMGFENKSNIIIRDIFDGGTYSDIIVVPSNRLDSISMLEWIFVGDEDSLFDEYNKLFGEDASQDEIIDLLEQIKLNVELFLSVPVCKKYFDSKQQ